jgi:hypothetical protein
MTPITITLDDQHLSKLRDLAAGRGLSPEQFLRMQLEEWLDRPGADFATAARYVLQKNAELYRRLA